MHRLSQVRFRAVAALAVTVLVLLFACPSCSRKSGSPEDKPNTGQQTAEQQAVSSQVRQDDGSRREGGPLNLILLSLDTTRKDRLSCYGFSKETTPNLDRIAAEGILFEQPYTPVPITLPAHASMLTGLYPYQHGVRNNGTYVLAAEHITLAELLKERGYETGAILGAFPVDHRFGLAQGFDHYDDLFPGGSRHREGKFTERSAEEVTRLALEWVDERRDRPFFLWAHYFDPHAPYKPPEPYRSRFENDRYSGEIAYMDDAIGKLFERLRSWDLLERTVIVIAGDHGESLGEHDELTHTIFIYGSTQRIPLIFRFPQGEPFSDNMWRGHRIQGLVNLVDIFPTAWDALGLPSETLPNMAGMNLLPTIQGQQAGHDWVYHESLVPDLEYGASELRGLQVARWKYIRAPKPELYDLENDPDELVNLAKKGKTRLQSLEDKLAAILSDESGMDSQHPMDEETIKKLRSLGYVAGSGVKAGATGQKLDPKDMKGIPMTVARVEALADQHLEAKALVLLDSLLSEHPEVKRAQLLRGVYLLRLGRSDEAIETLDRAIAGCQGCPDEPVLMKERAMASLKSGNLDDALRRTQILLEKNAEDEGLHIILGEILQAKRDWDGAREAFLIETELFPSDTKPWMKVASLEKIRKRPQEAEKAVRKALAINPKNSDALVMLSEILSSTGREQEAKTILNQVVKEDPTHPGAYFVKGMVLVKEGRENEAIQQFRTAVDLQPNNPYTLFQLGQLLMKKGQYDQALDNFEAAVATNQASQEVYANIGLVYARTGRYQDAIAEWEKAIEMDPQGSAVPTIRQNIRIAQEQLRSSSGQRNN